MEALIFIGVLILVIVIWVAVSNIKYKIFDEPREKISSLKKDIAILEQSHQKELSKIKERLANDKELNAHLVEIELADIILTSTWDNILKVSCGEYAKFRLPCNEGDFLSNRLKKTMMLRFFNALDDQYKYKYIVSICPKIKNLFYETKINGVENIYITQENPRFTELFDAVEALEKLCVDKNTNISELVNIFLQEKKLPEKEKEDFFSFDAYSNLRYNIQTLEEQNIALQKKNNQLSESNSDLRERILTANSNIHKLRNENREQLRSHEEILAYKTFKITELEEKIVVLESKISYYHSLKIDDMKRYIKKLENKLEFLKNTESNLTAIPYMAAIMADYETYGIENLAMQLDWGESKNRAHKVKSIREIRKDAQNIIEKYKEYQYQLAYLLKLFPALEDVVDAEFNQLPITDISELSEYDKTRDWLSKEEYLSLSESERNQLALDRYKESKNKTKWQIGRDYELYVGYIYSQQGFNVDYFGSYMGLEDLGRDLICKKGNKTLIVQCKYWSSKKVIHEKHITQLYGTLISYCIENNIPTDNVEGIIITNIGLSETARKMANHLNVTYIENYPVKDYPCIKCNIGHANGEEAKIYHLPFDQQYDSTKITKPGEFYAMTVAEAENAGFRRAHKHFNN